MRVSVRAVVVLVAALCLAGAAAAGKKALRAGAAVQPASGAAADVRAAISKIDRLLRAEGGAAGGAGARAARLQAAEAATRARFAEAKAEVSAVGNGQAEAKSAGGFGYGSAKSGAAAAPGAAAMRFASAGAGAAAGAGLPPQGNVLPEGLYSFGSPLGNGVQDYRSPHYGHFAGAYGPMSIAGEPFAQGSLSNALDPRGFGMSTANYSSPWAYGVHPMWPQAPGPFPLKVDAPFNPFQAVPPFSGLNGWNPGANAFTGSSYGFLNKMPESNATVFMGPLPFGPYGVTAHPYSGGLPGQWATNPGVPGLNPGYGMPNHGVIPTTRPGAAMGAAAAGFGMYAPGAAAGFFNPANPLSMGMGMPPIAGFPGAFGSLPGAPVAGLQTSFPQMAGLQPHPTNGFVVPPMYAPPASLVPSPFMGSHPGVALTGMGVGYPHPDFDRYHSVIGAPPPPPTAGGEGGAAPAL